jgi:hypothetical protein
MVLARRQPIQRHTKPDGLPDRVRRQHQVKIAGRKTHRDPPCGLVQRGELPADRPASRQGPTN